MRVGDSAELTTKVPSGEKLLQNFVVSLVVSFVERGNEHVDKAHDKDCLTGVKSVFSCKS